ncbi:lipopolysaccharide biosynthesis protein [Pseudomonas sp. 9AZ]|uniref:lipopolysaccharide biosynthesis protein n=1 Tax=Pseudomonas sp. 9AZ TaxID=2653168 RepID=UPI00135BA29C|nr:lipopolysaccharide biosynthesis protein [Pseudomonas sp. 9AZ]
MSSYWKSVASVLTGSALAQVIPIIGSLVIARLYAPADFGVFSAWFGIVLLLSVVLTGRFEMALAVEVDGEPRRLAVLSTLATACFVAGAAAILLAIGGLVAPGGMNAFPAVLIFASVPTGLAIAAAQTWQSWAAAEGSYRQLSMMRIAQAGAVTFIQVIAGAFHASADTLAISHLMGVIVGLAVSAYLMPVGTFPAGQAIVSIRSFWSRQRRFPLLSLPADAINTAAAQLPLLIVASRFGAETAGLLAMTMRILGAPIGLLGKSVLDVFKRHAATSFRERGECRSDYLRTFKVLALGSLAFCAVMAFANEPLFALAFGEEWRGAGTIAVWLLPLFALSFIASPLSYMVYIAGKQHVDLFWQIALLGMTISSLSIPTNHQHALQAYSAGYSMLYVIYLVMSYRFSLGVRS